jgi:hypothetical protein
MANWRYKLPEGMGKELHDLINSEDDSNDESLVEKIRDAYKWIAENVDASVTDTYEYGQVEEALELETFEQDDVNALLQDFYDYCDLERIWIGL